MAARTRNSISKTDMEASRLVFVYVKDIKPKRKVAVPVPDGYTWAEFIAQVKTKLKIVGVKEVFLAASGQKVTSLDELQDIDELCVVEGQEAPAGSSAAATEVALRAGVASTSATTTPDGEYRTQIMTPDGGKQHKVGIADGAVPKPTGGVDADESKYSRRAPAWKRSLQRVIPGIFSQPTLPVSSKDLEDRSTAPGSKRPRRKRSLFTARNSLMGLAILCCATTFLYFFFFSVKMP